MSKRKANDGNSSRSNRSRSSMDISGGFVGPMNEPGRSTSFNHGPSTIKRLKRVVETGKELKYIASNFAVTAITTTFPGILGTPFDVAQGVLDTQRVGDSLTWAGSIDFRIECTNAAGATGDTYDNIRVIIFQWFANQTPVLTDLLIPGPSTIPDVYSLYNHDRRHEYQILFDRVFTTVGAGSSGVFPATENFTTGMLNFKVPLTKARKNVQFSGGGITGTNRLYFCLFSDSTTVNHPTAVFTTKAVFRDS